MSKINSDIMKCDRVNNNYMKYNIYINNNSITRCEILN